MRRFEATAGRHGLAARQRLEPCAQQSRAPNCSLGRESFARPCETGAIYELSCKRCGNRNPAGRRRMIRVPTPLPLRRAVRSPGPPHRLAADHVWIPDSADRRTTPIRSVSARSVSAWLRHLPTQDVIARQHHVMRIFDGMRQSSRPIDLNRVAAIQFLDTALGADRRQLIKQYVENIDRSARVADRGVAGGAGAEPGLRLRLPDRRWSGRWPNNRIRAGSRMIPQLSRGCSTITAPTPSCAHSATSAGFPRSGRICTSSMPAPSELGVARVAVALPERRAGRDAMEHRAGIRLRAADPAAQHGQPVAGRDRLGERPDARLGQEARVRGRCRGRPRASTSISRASAASCGAPAASPARRCTFSTRRRSPTSSSARCTRCARPTSASPAPPPRSTSNASASWRRCARSWHRTSTAISAARRARRSRSRPRCASGSPASASS